MTQEQKLNKFIRDSILFNSDCLRIESMSSGMPDINACMTGLEVWIESKVFVTGRVLLRPEQYAWGHRRATHGGRVYVVAWHTKQNTLFLWRYPGVDCIQHGKYLQIISAPMVVIPKKSLDLRRILFDL
jgi:hypothetical protein